uniref:KIB1-4 beta-propeller domain-containing protein n=1 Tax=Setaria italica TaxID=4555 RepID=K3Y3C5_SETIT
MPEVPTDSCRKWRSVSTLGGQALFVGECSESLPAAECGVQEDCVYLISHYDESTPTVNPLHDSETVVVQTQGVRPSC